MVTYQIKAIFTDIKMDKDNHIQKENNHATYKKKYIGQIYQVIENSVSAIRNLNGPNYWILGLIL